jgi:hypothetical protein
MDAMRDSAATEAPDVLLDRLRQDGYVLVRDALPHGLVDRAAEELVGVLATFGWTRTAGEDGRLRRRPFFRRPDEDRFLRMYRALQACESLHVLLGDDAVRVPVEHLLGPSVAHPQRIVRTTLPVSRGGPRSPAVHRDFPSWQIEDMITAWVPLLDCPTRRGGLAVLAGSHRDRSGDLPEDFAGAGWATADYRRGDLLLFHCYAAHGALPNRTRSVRLSADSRWQRLSTPVPSDVLEPVTGGAWSDYTDGWESTASVSVDEHAVIDWVRKSDVDGLPPSPLLDQLSE